MDLGLHGKVALITGGSEGIGRATAELLASEGARVAICARRADRLRGAAEEIRQRTGGEVLDVPADVTVPEQLAAFVEAAAERWGRIDILVNNAGTAAAAPFERVTDEEWQRDLDLKLFAAIRASRAVIPHMRRVGGGRIILITHVGGKAPGPSSLPSSVSRAAGIALTKAMSKDLARENILVNTVCVGLIKSAQIERAARAHPPDLSLDEAYARMGANIPLGRVGEAEEVARVILALVSNLGSYVTGAAVNVDGGMGATV